MKIVILGAAGQIARLVTADLLAQTTHQLVLFARNGGKRLQVTDKQRATIVEGDFQDEKSLSIAMDGADFVYVNAMDDTKGLKAILATMKEENVNRIIGASILGIYDEVPGAFGAWNKRMVGEKRIKLMAENVSLVETSGLDYTILRLTWLYNQKNNRAYDITLNGEAFKGAQVTREAVSQLIVDIINEPTEKYAKTSLGVSEPDTNWDKPSFY
ncbi:MAG: SAM-dependent methyltransferase [Sphingobacteriaceae bacterium]|nr:MAG: SAM-dependent methyltransferase [Sphingobacteriaceae bacterium]